MATLEYASKEKKKNRISQRRNEGRNTSGADGEEWEEREEGMEGGMKGRKDSG